MQSFEKLGPQRGTTLNKNQCISLVQGSSLNRCISLVQWDNEGPVSRKPQTNSLRKGKRSKVFTAADSTPIQAHTERQELPPKWEARVSCDPSIF